MKVISLNNETLLSGEPTLIYEMTVRIKPDEALKMQKILKKLAKKGQCLHLKIDKKRCKE